MRKNKFVNPLQKASDTIIQSASPSNKKQNHKLMQNKIYFPASYQDSLMPYKIQSSYQNNKINFGQGRSNQMYQIEEKTKIKDRKERRLSFGRENKFEKLQGPKGQVLQHNCKYLVKYNTIELKNLPGISHNFSGATIYRSKNIKSSSKLLIQRSIQKPGNSQFRKNISFWDGQSRQGRMMKSKSNKQANQELKKKNFILHKTYFSDKSGLHNRSNNWRPVELGDFILEDKKQIVENSEDILLAKVIQRELYGFANGFQQQQLL